MRKYLQIAKATLLTGISLVTMVPIAHAELGYSFDDVSVLKVGMDTNRENNPNDGSMYIVVALPSGTPANICEFADGGNLYGAGAVSDLSDAFATEILSMGKTAIAQGMNISMEVDLENGCTIMGISLQPPN